MIMTYTTTSAKHIIQNNHTIIPLMAAHPTIGILRKFLTSLFCLSLLFGTPALMGQTTNETISTGSFIVNMGVTPQTVGNGLRPYGLVYDLVRNYNVPVKWVIRPDKPKDGIDFSYDGVDYRGGPFIIPAEFRTPAVDARITFWQGQGVVGATTVSPVTVPVFETIDFAPRWTLDAQNGGIAQKFLTNAGIPNTAYDWVSPQLLGACNDLFVMPHADPKWSTHSNLWDWNLTYKGGVWAGCHAVSAMEDMYNPVNPSQQMNFLSMTNGTTGPVGGTNYFPNALVLWGNHNDGSPPYNLAYPTDPVMQFMGKTDLAHQNGSEQIFLPVLGGGWRPTTKIGVWDPTQADIPVKSLGEAAVIAYGPAFGDPARGKILYEGGHDIGKGTGPDNIAAQRAFFNWSFWAGRDKALQVTTSGVSATMMGGETYPVSATVFASIPSGPYTYEWTSSCGGTFENPSAPSTVFYAPDVLDNTPCVVSVRVTDACGRTAFFSEPPVTVLPSPRPPVAVDDFASIEVECVTDGIDVVINVLANDSDPDGSALTVTSVSGNNGTWVNNGDGTVTFTPNLNFSGTATATYEVCDDTSPTPLCSTATITVGVGTPDANGCFPGFTFRVATTMPASAQTNNSVGNPGNALGDPDYDPLDDNTYAELDNNSDWLLLDFGSVIMTADSVRVYFASRDEGVSVTMALQYGTDAGGPFTLAGNFSTSSNEDGAAAAFAVPPGGLRYVRIQRSAGTPRLWIDAAEVEDWDCQSTLPIAGNDEVSTPEDVPLVIFVLDNDASPSGSALSVTAITSPPSFGLVSINPDGTITYVNNTDVSGTDMFTYQVCDTEGFCSSATVTVTVTPDGCDPGQFRPINFGAPVTITLNPIADAGHRQDSPNNNYDTDNKFEIGKKPNKVRRGFYQFDLSSLPAGAIISDATFSIRREGGDGATLSLSVHRVTQPWTEGGLTWNNRQSLTPWGTPGGDFNPTAWASTLADGTKTYKDFGVASLVQAWANGTYPNYGLMVKQSDETALDKRHNYDTREQGDVNRKPKLVITYLTQFPCQDIPNRAPLANLDVATTPSDMPLTIPVLANDADPDGNPLTLASIIGPVTGGTATISGNNILFTPDGVFIGTTSFQYSVSDGSLTDVAEVQVTVTNAAPVANDDNPAPFLSNTANNVIPVQANDINPDGPGPMTTEIILGPQFGSATVSGTDILYTPTTNYYGTDLITYRICEPSIGLCGEVPLCDTAQVFITVNNRPPVANPDIAFTNGCQPIFINATANDTDPENQPILITAATVTTPGAGQAIISPNGQAITYIPSPTASGSVTISYTICDNAVPTPACASSTIVVTVNTNNPAVNSPPVAVNDIAEDITREQIAFIPVLANDSDPEGSTLTISAVFGLSPAGSGTIAVFGNQVSFTPHPDFIGTAFFFYTVCDEAPPVGPGCLPLPPQCSNATVAITVVNQPPSPQDDNVTTGIDQPRNIFVLLNDSEPDGDALILQPGGVTAEGGTMVLNNNGTPGDPSDDYYVYTPPMGFSGVDQFTYQVCDDVPPPFTECATATINITVAAPIDLELSKTFSPMTPVEIGDIVSFTLTLTNQSSTPATGVTVLDMLSASYNYISSSGTGTYDPVFGTWAIGNVAGNSTVSITIQAKVVNYAAFLNLAQVFTANQPDIDSTPGNLGAFPVEDDEDQALPLCVPPAAPAAIFRQQQP